MDTSRVHLTTVETGLSNSNNVYQIQDLAALRMIHFCRISTISTYKREIQNNHKYSVDFRSDEKWISRGSGFLCENVEERLVESTNFNR